MRGSCSKAERTSADLIPYTGADVGFWWEGEGCPIFPQSRIFHLQRHPVEESDVVGEEGLPIFTQSNVPESADKNVHSEITHTQLFCR